jgi:hypothetical protein
MMLNLHQDFVLNVVRKNKMLRQIFAHHVVSHLIHGKILRERMYR